MNKEELHEDDDFPYDWGTKEWTEIPHKPGEDSDFQKAILNGLSRKPIYRGTVPEHIKQKRRAKNRVARASRKANRK